MSRSRCRRRTRVQQGLLLLSPLPSPVPRAGTSLLPRVSSLRLLLRRTGRIKRRRRGEEDLWDQRRRELGLATSTVPSSPSFTSPFQRTHETDRSLFFFLSSCPSTSPVSSIASAKSRLSIRPVPLMIRAPFHRPRPCLVTPSLSPHRSRPSPIFASCLSVFVPITSSSPSHFNDHSQRFTIAQPVVPRARRAPPERANNPNNPLTPNGHFFGGLTPSSRTPSSLSIFTNPQQYQSPHQAPRVSSPALEASTSATSLRAGGSGSNGTASPGPSDSLVAAPPSTLASDVVKLRIAGGGGPGAPISDPYAEKGKAGAFLPKTVSGPMRRRPAALDSKGKGKASDDEYAGEVVSQIFPSSFFFSFSRGWARELRLRSLLFRPSASASSSGSIADSMFCQSLITTTASPAEGTDASSAATAALGRSTSPASTRRWTSTTFRRTSGSASSVRSDEWVHLSPSSDSKERELTLCVGLRRRSARCPDLCPTSLARSSARSRGPTPLSTGFLRRSESSSKAVSPRAVVREEREVECEVLTRRVFFVQSRPQLTGTISTRTRSGP